MAAKSTSANLERSPTSSNERESVTQRIASQATHRESATSASSCCTGGGASTGDGWGASPDAGSTAYAESQVLGSGAYRQRGMRPLT